MDIKILSNFLQLYKSITSDYPELNDKFHELKKTGSYIREVILDKNNNPSRYSKFVYVCDITSLIVFSCKVTHFKVTHFWGRNGFTVPGATHVLHQSIIIKTNFLDLATTKISLMILMKDFAIFNLVLTMKLNCLTLL